ncbi:hypothetical protein [Botrimarina sp.]|uniref:hypothetical protein n=1 Tax=Botrimarina sp. TaxID=2795802 RepID=UPI0032EF79B1
MAVLAGLVVGCPAEVPYEAPEESAAIEDTSVPAAAPPTRDPAAQRTDESPDGADAAASPAPGPTGAAPWQSADSDEAPPDEARDLFSLAEGASTEPEGEEASASAPSDAPAAADDDDGFGAFLDREYANLPTSNRQNGQRSNAPPADGEPGSPAPSPTPDAAAATDAAPRSAYGPPSDSPDPEEPMALADGGTAQTPEDQPPASNAGSKLPWDEGPLEAADQATSESKLPDWMTADAPPEPTNGDPTDLPADGGPEAEATAGSTPAADDASLAELPSGAPELPDDFGEPAGGAPASDSPPAEPDQTDLPGAAPAEPRVASAGPTPGAPRGSSTQAAEPLPAVPVLPFNTRHLAWLLGSKLGLIELAALDGGNPEDVAAWSADVERLAKELGVAPPAGAPSEGAAAERVAGLIQAAGKTGAELARERGVDHAALFEIAVKSNALLAIAERRPDLAAPVADAIRDAADRARLPGYVWRDAVQALAGQPTPEQATDAVMKLHRQVESYLR